MTVADLIAKLQTLPPELSVMLTVSEGGVDHARVVRVADVARHRLDWSFTGKIGDALHCMEADTWR